MRIVRFELRIVEIPMRVAVEHALAKRKLARNLLVAAFDDNGLVGWGECCPRDYVTGETIESVEAALERELLPRFHGRSFPGIAAVAEALSAELPDLPRDRHAAFCALELALLDLAGRRFGVSAGTVLGPVLRPRARYSAVIASSGVLKAGAMAAVARIVGASEVKVKTLAELERNQRLLRVTRAIMGQGASLRIDANAAWNADEAIRQLDALRPFRLEGCEQPVPGQDIAGMAAVTAARIVPVVADESLCSHADGERLVHERGCDIFNLRVSKNGGLLNTLRLHRLAKAAGLRCQLGAQVGETGLLSAAGRHVATRLSDIVWCEGSYGRILLRPDIVVPDVTVGRGGWAPALDAPGLGVTPDPRLLERFTTAHRGFG
jgi:L-alanine-DL-glutamate epimerase-like enolase superfamily enzyme